MGIKKDVLTRLEETQAALRASIEQARLLTEESEGLLQKHKREAEARDPAAKREAYQGENPV